MIGISRYNIWGIWGNKNKQEEFIDDSYYDLLEIDALKSIDEKEFEKLIDSNTDENYNNGYIITSGTIDRIVVEQKAADIYYSTSQMSVSAWDKYLKELEEEECKMLDERYPSEVIESRISEMQQCLQAWWMMAS